MKGVEELSKGCQESICHLSDEKKMFVIELTQVFNEYWEETIEYVEKSDERDIRRDLRLRRRLSSTRRK